MSDRHPVLRAALFISLVVLLLAGAAVSGRAQEAKPEEKKELIPGKWYPNVEAGLNLSQSSFSDNWYGGDKGSIVWTAIANSSLENQFNTRMNWRNTLKLAFGETALQKADSLNNRYWEEPQKSTDLIDFESVLRLTLGAFVDPFASAAFQSQFQDASDPAGRRLSFNPMQFKESAGIARKFFDTEDQTLLSRLGFTFRQNARRVFVDPAPSKRTASETTNDGGIEWVTENKSKILQKRVAWTSKLIVYQPVFYSGKKDLDNLSDTYMAAHGIDQDVASLSTQISSDWENIFTSQITKVISVSLYTRWIYDAYDNSVKPLSTDHELTNPADVRRAVRKAGQFAETMSIGLTYRFL